MDERDGPAAPRERQPAPRRHSRRALLATLGVAGLGAAGLGVARALGVAGASSRALARPTPTASPTRVPTATPEPTATPDTRPATIVVTGDVMLARTVTQQMVASHDQFPFNYTASFLKGFDLTVGNLECVVSRMGSAIPGKQFTFEADPLGFQRLVDAGYDIVSVANNHSGDYGKDAFADMFQRLPDFGISPLGGGMSYAEAHTPVFRSVRSTTVGFLAYCEIGPQDFAATSTTPGHAWLDPDAMRADIAAARARCDFLIVFTHWGIEYVTVENGHQQDMAHAAIDAGADLVVGCHPHVIQPNETYRGKLIVYSLGNFVFDYMTAPLTSSCNVLALTIQRSSLLDWKLVHATIGDWGQPAFD
jgi:poly-gamma-glutamate capsule biosynthesis protein CapA/YwtB (metallophosphatase superfamily)